MLLLLLLPDEELECDELEELECDELLLEWDVLCPTEAIELEANTKATNEKQIRVNNMILLRFFKENIPLPLFIPNQNGLHKSLKLLITLRDHIHPG
ncbi:MAG TPA: hypothetical protein VN426_05235 [Syntrophomonadaceae bacterium]|nr:hypothetical protein [Syntrophomonadaceae bacterium]